MVCSYDRGAGESLEIDGSLEDFAQRISEETVNVPEHLPLFDQRRVPASGAKRSNRTEPIAFIGIHKACPGLCPMR